MLPPSTPPRQFGPEKVQTKPNTVVAPAKPNTVVVPAKPNTTVVPTKPKIAVEPTRPKTALVPTKSNEEDKAGELNVGESGET